MEVTMVVILLKTIVFDRGEFSIETKNVDV
jgi:hypothetical protein